MKNLVWSAKFLRKFKRLTKKNAQLSIQIEKVLELLMEDPFDSSLRTHKLKLVIQLMDKYSLYAPYSGFCSGFSLLRLLSRGASSGGIRIYSLGEYFLINLWFIQVFFWGSNQFI